MFVLETIVGQVDHKVGFIFNILFIVIFNTETQIPRMIKNNGWIAVDEHVASNVELFFV